jgi:hypothetical protein
MKLRAGEQLASTVCATRVVVVRAPDGDVELTCGGADMVSLDDGEPTVSGEPAAGHDAGTQLGKRYAEETLGLELLCSKPGAGSIWCNGAPLLLKAAKPLPASD